MSVNKYAAMGQAYIQITDEVGPDPQLVAFVNYDENANDQFAFESLDMFSQHLKILNQIKNAPGSVEEKSGEIDQLLVQIDESFKEADRARAYITITKQYGPSKQLLRFINYDNSLEQHVGIGLESMDFLDQHQFLLAKLDPDALDSIATESLKDAIIKYRKWLIAAGILLPGPTLPLLIAGIAGVAMNRKMKGEVPTVKQFTALTKIFDAASKQSSLFTSSLPSDLSEKSWKGFDTESFDKELDALKDELAKANDSQTNKTVPIVESGWTAETYVNAVKWVKVTKEKTEAAEKSQATKFEHLESGIDSDEGAKVVRYVSPAISKASQLSRFYASILDDIGNLLVKVSHHFTPTGKGES